LQSLKYFGEIGVIALNECRGPRVEILFGSVNGSMVTVQAYQVAARLNLFQQSQGMAGSPERSIDDGLAGLEL